jgi:lauroyl/myristoyl acyltransferase
MVVRARLLRARRDPAALNDARRHTEFLLGVACPGIDLDDAAMRYLEFMTWRGELRWHPRCITRQRVLGLDDLLAVRDPQRGLIVNFMHHGHIAGAFPSLSRAGLPCHVVAGDNHFGPEAPEYSRQQLRVVSMGAAGVINVAEGSTPMKEVLSRGGSLAIATDVPGRTPITFVGRKLLGSSGAARIAFDTNAPVITVTTHRDGDGLHLRLSAPLEPTDFASPLHLLGELVARHERAILAWPEAYEQPLNRWGRRVPGRAQEG